jgi:hypothetical protein
VALDPGSDGIEDLRRHRFFDSSVLPDSPAGGVLEQVIHAGNDLHSCVEVTRLLQGGLDDGNILCGVNLLILCSIERQNGTFDCGESRTRIVRNEVAVPGRCQCGELILDPLL